MPAEQVVTGYQDTGSTTGTPPPWQPLGRARGAVAVPASTTVSARMAFQITCSSSGTVNATLSDGTSITLSPAVGDNIYPFGVIWWNAGSATVSWAFNLY